MLSRVDSAFCHSTVQGKQRSSKLIARHLFLQPGSTRIRRPYEYVACSILLFCIIRLFCTVHISRCPKADSVPAVDEADVSPPAQERQPLTRLGYAADLMYDTIGVTRMDDYRHELEDFVKQQFPMPESEDRNHSSLLHAMHTFLPPPPAPPCTPRRLNDALKQVFLGLWGHFRSPVDAYQLPLSGQTTGSEHPGIQPNIYQIGIYKNGKQPMQAGRQPPGKMERGIV